MSIAEKNASLQGLNQDINLVTNLQLHAQKMLQHQQISNMIHGSQQHIPSSMAIHRSPISQTNYGSLTHIPQNYSPQQPIYFNNVRAMGRNSNQFINEQGQYISPASNNHQSYIDNENGSSGILQYEQPHQVRNLNKNHELFISIYIHWDFLGGISAFRWTTT